MGVSRGDLEVHDFIVEMGDLGLHGAYGVQNDLELWHDDELIVVFDGGPRRGRSVEVTPRART